MKKKFGEMLLERGLITPSQLADALELQRRRGMRLGAALVQRGHITESQLVAALGTLLHLPVVELSSVSPDMEAVRMVKPAFASENDLFPYGLRHERGRKVLTVAMSDPLNYRVTDELGFICDAIIEPVLAKTSEIDLAIRKYYGGRITTADLGEAPMRLAMEEPDSRMTIVRPGGNEEVVETETGRLVSPYIKGPDGKTIPNPALGDRAPPPLEDDEVLLIEEVEASAPPGPGSESTPIPLTEVKQRTGDIVVTGAPPSTQPHAAVQTHAPAQAAPVAPAHSGGSAPIAGSHFDFALGALIDAAGGAVNAESFYHLERRFWALMRILARKGLITNEEFQAELGEDRDF